MREIHVSLVFKSPPEKVFAALSDHETFLQGRKLSCRLVREGSLQRNGDGAQREVRSGGLVFIEDISRFQPPHGYDYRVLSLSTASGRRLPFRHERGWLTLTAEGEGTRVDWRSRFRIAVPVLSWFLEPLIASSVSQAFGHLLLRTRAQLDAGQTLPEFDGKA